MEKKMLREPTSPGAILLEEFLLPCDLRHVTRVLVESAKRC